VRWRGAAVASDGRLPSAVAPSVEIRVEDLRFGGFIDGGCRGCLEAGWTDDGLAVRRR
jgi:hypothetical protein